MFPWNSVAEFQPSSSLIFSRRSYIGRRKESINQPPPERSLSWGSSSIYRFKEYIPFNFPPEDREKKKKKKEETRKEKKKEERRNKLKTIRKKDRRVTGRGGSTIKIFFSRRISSLEFVVVEHDLTFFSFHNSGRRI